MYKPIIIVWFFSLMGNILLAQNSVIDSNKVSPAQNNAIGLFNKGIGKQSRLYNGAEYEPYALYINNNPYFDDTKDFIPAVVNFDGFIFKNVPVKYDLFKNELITIYANSGSVYILASEKVKYFTLLGRNFKYISSDTVRNGPGSGFYEELYNGKFSALVKYSKTLQSSTSSVSVDSHFSPVKKEFFIQKGADIKTFSSKGSLLSIFKDHKKQLQQYIKVNNINYSAQPEKAIIMIASYYDRLTN